MINKALIANHHPPIQMEKYTSLDQKGIVIAEYVWIDSEGNTRSKTRVSISPGTSMK